MSKHKTYRHTMQACYIGFVSQAIINNLAPLLFVIFQDSFAISLSKISWLILINFGTQLTVDVLCVKYADRIGYRPLMIAAHVFCALGLIFMSALPNISPSPYTGLVFAVVTYAIGGGLLEVLASPIIDSLPSEAKAASMSLGHAFYCWGHVAVVILTTALLTLIGSESWFILPLLWAIIPAYNALNFARVPLKPVIAEQERMPLRTLIQSKLFILAILMMICSGASEQAMSQWASLFAEKGLHVSKIVGDLLGPCLFALCMGAGRTIYGIWGKQINLTRALIGCAALCIVCYLVSSLVANPFIALIGCAVTGFSVSLMWPGMVSLSARLFSTGGTAVFGLLAMGGDIGCGFGPWLTGIISGAAQGSQTILSIGARMGLDPLQTGLKTGLLLAIVFPLLLLIGVAVIKKMADKGRSI